VFTRNYENIREKCFLNVKNGLNLVLSKRMSHDIQSKRKTKNLEKTKPKSNPNEKPRPRKNQTKSNLNEKPKT